VLRAQRRHEEAIPEYEAAIALNHNWVVAIAALGLARFLGGSLDEAIPAQEQAIRLSPRDRACPIGIGGSAWCICCNRAPRRQSFG